MVAAGSQDMDLRISEKTELTGRRQRRRETVRDLLALESLRLTDRSSLVPVSEEEGSVGSA